MVADSETRPAPAERVSEEPRSARGPYRARSVPPPPAFLVAVVLVVLPTEQFPWANWPTEHWALYSEMEEFARRLELDRVSVCG